MLPDEGFASILSRVFLQYARTQSARFALDSPHFDSFLLHVREAWHLMKQESDPIPLEQMKTEEVVDYVQFIVPFFNQNASNQQNTRDDLLEQTAQRLGYGKFDMKTVGLLRFAVYVWTMCIIEIPRKNTPPQGLHPEFKYWAQPQLSLPQQLCLFTNQPNMGLDDVKLEKTFRVYDIVKISKFAVHWVDDIFEHLSLESPDPGKDNAPFRIRIYHHRSFLRYHLDSQSAVFPDGFIDETLRTLDLLLPYEHKQTRNWYGKEARAGQLDSTACEQGRQLDPHLRKIDSFTFWRERLTILKETYDELEPDTLYRFWLDKRRPVQWATFWVAVLVLILTIFFGLVQSIEGALQVYKAYHPS